MPAQPIAKFEVVDTSTFDFAQVTSEIGIDTHRLVNAVKFPTEGGNGPVKLLKEKSLMKKVEGQLSMLEYFR
jgi:hypothetical protein